MKRRVVITSLGLVSSLGFTWTDIRAAFTQEHVTFRPDDHFPDVMVCPIPDFDLQTFIGRNKNRRYLNRGAALAVAAAAQAVRNSGLEPGHLAEAGLFVGSGPNLDMPELAEKSLQALWMLGFLPNTAASLIARIFGIHGENNTINTACSASLQAAGEGYRRIRDGYLDVCLAGGGDSRLSKGGLLAYKKAKALHLTETGADFAYAPFDLSRHGFVPGEGGGFLLLEEKTHAEKRGATILGEICGYGCSLDGGNLTAPQPEGVWAEKAVRRAIAQADLAPADMDLVVSHGTGTVLNDAMEADLVCRLFDPPGPWVVAFKSWIGHLASACGTVELILALQCMQHGLLPKIRNLQHPCHPDTRLVRENREAAVATALIQSFGFGGQNSAVVFRTWNPL